MTLAALTTTQTASYATLSSHLVWASMTVLTVAMIAFLVDLTKLGESRGVVAAAVRESRDAELVTAGAGGSGATAGTTASVPSDAPPSAPGDVEDGTQAGPRRKAVGIAMSLTVLGWLLLGAAIVTRGIAAGRAPWANMYEFTLVGSFVALTVFLLVNRFRDVRFLGAFVTLLTVLFMALGQEVFFVQADGVQPALQSYWLVIHVGVAITATGILTVAFVTSVLQLFKDSRDNGSGLMAHRGFRFLDGLPKADKLEVLSFRLNAVGFVLWTFTLIAGAIWAEHAWGRYWGWDPKEVWTFIVWIVYAAYLHARTTRGWSGRRAAYFVLVGYACVLFNFTGVNLIFNGKHSYSGLTS
ncbi:c-type cytochrome biogenesis protein CcsB [Luteimicrobium subarcticum]|uniref:Cytochrome c-type biogenesis protein CcsB n=1 Tax=Luteimicrobium subarcticum TaxID=620910 RepID=A0A2M8WVR5_9MICO|nr:c-type cytochrome biogenesis protein CcsB [Luteimicrobium subarcticum]PJI95015.1 cytochrome c-type biogenesis protein CcsB [Luteimicrobium subarcticum]